MPLELQPGQMSIHSDKTVHGSGLNHSDIRRCGIALRYCPPVVRPTDPAWGQNAILCRGSDPYGHFNLVEKRPEGDDVLSWRNYMMIKMIEERRRKKKSM